MVSTSFPREILVHESTELGCCWGGRFGIRITTSTNVEDHDENENRANDIEIALARPKQTRLRRRPEQVFSCHLSLRDLSTTSRETNRVEGRRHLAIVPSATYPSNAQTTTTLGIHQQRWLRKVVDQGSAVTSRPVQSASCQVFTRPNTGIEIASTLITSSGDQETASFINSINQIRLLSPIKRELYPSDFATYLSHSTLTAPSRHVEQ